MTIHTTHPFADPEPDPMRRFRGRLGGTVSLWTSGSGGDRAGLTVTSLLVAGGEPARVIALLDPDSNVAEAIEVNGRAVVQLLTWDDRGLADAFAGTTPAPGGPFRQAEFTETAWGPRLASATTWLAVSLERTVTVGWSSLVTCVVDEVTVGDDEPLVHRRGRYQRPRADGQS